MSCLCSICPPRQGFIRLQLIQRNSQTIKLQHKGIGSKATACCIYFCPNPFFLVDGSPNDQLLTIYRSDLFTACSPSQDLFPNLFPIEYQMCAPCTMIAHWLLCKLTKFKPRLMHFIVQKCLIIK